MTGPSDRLEGIIPVVEDWHSRMTLMRVVLFLKLYASYEFYFYYMRKPTISPKKQNRVKRVEVKIGKFFQFFSF